MAIGKQIERRGHIVGFKEEISKAAAESEDAFFTWFDSAKDKDAAFVRGSWDFMIHIAQPATRFLSVPEDKVALEIGHGGGRILAAASRYFKHVIGVDVHENNPYVEKEFAKRAIANYHLIRTEGKEIPVEGASVDFVYSFIVFQHVEKFSIFKNYMKEAYRVLKPNGIAVIYFGRRYFLSVNRSARLLYLIDTISERLLLRNGFQEIPERVNCTNLLVSLSHAKRLSRRIGFEVLSELVSRKKVPDGVHLFGVQNGLVIRKK